MNNHIYRINLYQNFINNINKIYTYIFLIYNYQSNSAVG